MKHNLKDRLLWVLITLVTLGFLLLSRQPMHVGSEVKTMVGLGWLAVVVLSFLMTKQGKQAWATVLDAKQELQMVVWPTRAETVQVSMVVCVVVTVVSLMLWLIDNGLFWLVGKLTALT